MRLMRLINEIDKISETYKNGDTGTHIPSAEGCVERLEAPK
jgi:hypothetical protein